MCMNLFVFLQTRPNNAFMFQNAPIGDSNKKLQISPFLIMRFAAIILFTHTEYKLDNRGILWYLDNG